MTSDRSDLSPRLRVSWRSLVWAINVSVSLVFGLHTTECKASTRRAILIGINSYSSPPAPSKALIVRKPLVTGDVRHWVYRDLIGPLNDIDLIKSFLLSSDFGFSKADIVELSEQKATADAILSTLQAELVDNATKGDIRFVFYAGHGNYIKNPDSPEQDKLDQTIVPSDHNLGVADVRDKELSRILWAAAKKRVTVTFIADSCHSGSLSRGPQNSRSVRSNSGIRSSWAEPVIRDAGMKDPESNHLINPEELGVLTLFAVQRNDEEIEQVFKEDPRRQVHGALTWALVKAIQTEGPHASMNAIYSRILDILGQEGLSETPIKGGAGRDTLDILGQPASTSSFTVSVKAISKKTVVLRGGQAIGLYEGTELTSARGETRAVVKSSDLTESTAETHGNDLKVGDHLTVTSWASTRGPILTVHLPPAAESSVLEDLLRKEAAFKSIPSVAWVEDPSEQYATDIFRWDGKVWILDHVPTATSTEIGKTANVPDVSVRLQPGSALFVDVPPTQDLIKGIQIGDGSTNSAIQKITDGLTSAADFHLVGRLSAGKVKYAWLATDAEVRANSASRDEKFSRSSLPFRTAWFPKDAGTLNGCTGGQTSPDLQLSREPVPQSLTDSAVRLGRINAWLTLQGRPGSTTFPYDLCFRNVKSGKETKPGEKLVDGEEFRFFLRLKPNYKLTTVPRRWIYIFLIDQTGKLTLFYPFPESPNEGNHIPLIPNEQSKTANTKTSIDLPLDSAEAHDLIGCPFGTDTYFLLATDTKIENPQLVFQGNSVRSAEDPLAALLQSVGSFTRSGGPPPRAPGGWSISRYIFESVAKDGK